MLAISNPGPKTSFSRSASETKDERVAFAWPIHEVGVVQGKASVPRPQDTLALGENAARDLLFLIEPNKNGKISKQAWMRFMGEEFDRLDKDKKGELDAQELHSEQLIKHARQQDLGK
jgi:hypothetical protein